MSPQATPIGAILRMAQTDKGAILCFAGTPVAKPAPNGMQEIMRLSRQTTVGPAIGLTRIQSSAAFTPPAIQTTTSINRVGPRVQHFATFQRTTSQDATHESFYPAPGLHAKPVQAGRRANEFWEVTEALSSMVLAGEQEHLDDARRAYELTYQSVENEINRLVGRQFGPATTPHAATEMAVAELARRLPVQLGTNPATWVAMLDKLLTMSKSRDTNLWHSIETDSIRQEGNQVIERLKPSTFFQHVSASRVVNL